MLTYRLPASHNNIAFFSCLWFIDDVIIDNTTVIVSACAAGAFLCTCVLFMAFVIKWNSSRGLLQLWLEGFLFFFALMNNRSGCWHVEYIETDVEWERCSPTLSSPNLITVFNLILVVYLGCHDYIWAVNLPFAVNFQYIRNLFLIKWATSKGDTSLF